MAKFGDKIQKTAKIIIAGEVRNEGNRSLDEFTVEPITEWDKAVIIKGESGTGKTQFALAHFEKPLLVSQIEDLKRYEDGVHDGIVFDDVSFWHLPRTGQIHVVDIEQTRSIWCRFNNAVIPAGTKKVFTCNEWPLDINEPAVARRVKLITLEGDIRATEQREMEI